MVCQPVVPSLTQELPFSGASGKWGVVLCPLPGHPLACCVRFWAPPAPLKPLCWRQCYCPNPSKIVPSLPLIMSLPTMLAYRLQTYAGKEKSNFKKLEQWRKKNKMTW